MIRHRYAALAAAIVAIAGLRPAQRGVAYAPGAGRYHLISVINRTQEHAGQKAEFTITNEQQVSVRLAAHGTDTLDFTYTLDSSRLSTNAPIELPNLDRMRGTTVTGSMSPTGTVYRYTATPPATDDDMRNFVEGMSRFLLPLERTAVGSSWTDTTRNTVTQGGGRLDMSTITTTTIVGDTTFAGERAWRIRRASVVTLQGKQTQAGQELQVAGEGTGSGVYYVSAAGMYLGSSQRQTMQMRVSLPGNAGVVPVTQVVTSKVELMK